MQNIRAIIGDYQKSEKEKLKMCTPVVVYLNTNYPKQHIGLQGNDLNDYHKLTFAHKSYANHGDNIFFQIFPVGAVDETSKNDFKLMQKYSTQGQKYYNYPSMMLTPTGTLMTSPILFDALQPFLNNGIQGDGKNTSSDLNKNNHIYGESSHSAFSSFFNWSAQWGGFNSDTGADPQSSVFFTPKKSGQAGYMSMSVGNFGMRQKGLSQKSQNKYSYVKALSCPRLGIEYSPRLHPGRKFLTKRVYKLLSYNIQNPLKAAVNYMKSINSQDADFMSDYNFAETMGAARPFAFIINFSNGQNISANIDFGYNRIQVTNNQLFLTVSDVSWYDTNGMITWTSQALKGHARRAQCSSCFDSNTKAPFFYRQDKGLNSQKSTYFITYPAYCGAAIQPGIHFPNNTQSSKQSPALRGVGSVVQKYVEKKRRVPTLQTWLQLEKQRYKISKSGNVSNSQIKKSNGSIFLQANPVNWNSDSLRLTINNGSANFFYMPLYFVSKCRFRMYFKGIKSGEYSTNGIPTSSVYVNQSQASTASCTQTATWQYKSQSVAGSAEQSFTAFAKHQYYGSLLYTTNYNLNNGSNSSSIATPNASYITTPVSSYYIKPILTPKSNWGEYSMDGYYFDFTIDLIGKKEGNQYIHPYIRQPLQVLGVLVMQVIQYQKSMLQNDNGKFKIQQSTLYPTTATEKGQLPITSVGGTNDTTSWHQYIQNISINWTQQGGSGQITLDKYALIGQQAFPQQSIGGLSISMVGGNPNIINTSSSSATSRSSCIFTGFGTKMSMQDSFGSDTINIQLQGPQRKLTDLKLINPPFWDGDLLETAYDWLQNYCGIDIVMDDDKYFNKETSFNQAAETIKNYIDSNGEQQTRLAGDFPRFPTSSNFKRPAVYIKTGQDSFSVLKKLAEMCNCRFVLQPDGKAYIMTQTTMAVPQMCDARGADSKSAKGQAQMGYNAVFNQELILNYSIQPLLNNLHNYIITASFYAAETGNTAGESKGSVQAGFKVNKKFKKLKTTPEIPWAKVKAFKHQGFMTQERTLQQFERDVYAVSSYWLSVKVTIPGNAMIWIYDKLKMFGIDYYVTEVSHNIDLVNKKWTTQLTLSNVLKSLSSSSSN